MIIAQYSSAPEVTMVGELSQQMGGKLLAMIGVIAPILLNVVGVIFGILFVVALIKAVVNKF